MERCSRSWSCRYLLWALALLNEASCRYARKSVATSVRDFFLNLVNLVSILFACNRRDETLTVQDDNPNKWVGIAAPAFVTVICLVLAVLAAWAQMGAPPRAQRANGSQLSTPQTSPVNQRPAIASRTPSPAEKTPSPARDPVLYENGPVIGTVASWPINGGVVVSDTFTLLGSANVQGFDIWVWESPGDQVSTLEWSITSAENGGTTFGSGTASVLDTFLTFNQFGFDIDELTVSGLNVPLQAGTFWLNVQNASVPSGKTVFWDQNSGANCGSPGCPSQASESAVGTIPSETFDITGAQTVPTSTTLSVAPPSPAVAGQVLTFTATVTSNPGPVPVGTVTFSNGGQVLGTVQMVQVGNFPGTATLKLRFGPGTYSFTANYNGTNSFQPSQSSAQPYTVTGTEPTITTLTAQPDGSNYDFTDSVFGFGFPPPTGSATVNDLTEGGFNLGNIGLAAPGQSSFQGVPNSPAGSSAFFLTTGDFNGDGIPDLALSNGDLSGGGNTVSVLLGKGDGTFQPPTPYQIPAGPSGVTAWDFNGDGKLDLAVGRFNPPNQGISVLLGNGDGTFQIQPPYNVGVEPTAVVVGDFNFDGAPDLAVADFGGFVLVLLNNGDGTFTPEQQTFPAGEEPMAIAVGDFNGDGKLDVAVADHFSQVAVLLGNGNGTFQPAKFFSTGNFPFGIAVGDLNGDGILDLAVSNLEDSTVSVLLGNGDGTFNTLPPIDIGIPIGPAGIVIADLNGDGFLDIAVSTGISNGDTVTVLLGNGDGTFQPFQRYPLPPGGAPIGLVTADFNGDGVPDLAAANNAQGAASVLLGGTLAMGELKNVPVPGVGNQNIQSTYTPNTNFYTGSVSNIVTVTGNGEIPTTTALSSSQNPSSYLQPVTFRATVTAVGGGSPTGTVTFTADGNVICAAVPLIPIRGGSVATCSIATLTIGPHSIVGSYSGDSNFAPSQSPAFDQVVNMAVTTTIVTASPPSPSSFGQLVTFTATVTGAFGGSPTGTVTFTADGNIICSAVPLVPIQNGSTATCQTVLALGSHTIRTTYSGDSNYTGSLGTLPYQVTKSNTVIMVSSAPNPSQLLQLVTITAVVSGQFGGTPTGTVDFTDGTTVICRGVPLNNGVATCQTSTLAVGTHQLGASYNGDQNFNSSNGVTTQTVVQPMGDFSLLITPGNVTVTEGYNNTNDSYFAQTINLTVQPLSGYNGTVTLSCSVNPTLVNGTCVVNPPTSGSLATGNLNTTLTISAGSTTPIGPYTVTVTVQDNSGLMHFTTLALNVINNAPGITMLPGGAGMTMVSYNGPPGVTIPNFACTAVTGTGITGSEDLSKIGGVCTFGPGPVNLPGSVKVTISGCTVARLRSRTQIFAAFWLCLPAMVLLGSVRIRSLPRKRMLEILGTLLLLLALLLGVGCGGGYGTLSPAGSYLVLVQGTGSDGLVYSGVVPVTVSSVGNH